MKMKMKKKRLHRNNTNRLNPKHGRKYTTHKISNTFISNAQLKLTKNQEKAKSTLRLTFCYLKTFYFLHPRLSSGSNIAHSKKRAKKQVRLF